MIKRWGLHSDIFQHNWDEWIILLRCCFTSMSIWRTAIFALRVVGEILEWNDSSKRNLRLDVHSRWITGKNPNMNVSSPTIDENETLLKTSNLWKPSTKHILRENFQKLYVRKKIRNVVEIFHLKWLSYFACEAEFNTKNINSKLQHSATLHIPTCKAHQDWIHQCVCSHLPTWLQWHPKNFYSFPKGQWLSFHTDEAAGKRFLAQYFLERLNLLKYDMLTVHATT